jgi:hypothetical protein
LKAYRQKLKTILAEPWYKMGDVPEAPIIKCSEKGKCRYCRLALNLHGYCLTKETQTLICPGDWIIKGINGIHFPMKAEEFHKNFEKV